MSVKFEATCSAVGSIKVWNMCLIHLFLWIKIMLITFMLAFTHLIFDQENYFEAQIAALINSMNVVMGFLMNLAIEV